MTRSLASRFLPAALLALSSLLLLAAVSPPPAAARQEGGVPLVGFPEPGQSFQGGQGFSDPNRAVNEIDRFWRDTLAAAGIAYRPPAAVVLLDGPILTLCGPASPETSFAFYCPLDESIYFSPLALMAVMEEFGDYAPITILSHEWGHHVQTVLQVPNERGNAFELQADCMAGAWTQHARDLGMLDKGDVTEAAALSARSGDDYNASQQERGAHGIDDERIASFMRGFDDGVGDCGLPLDGNAPAPAPGSSGQQVPAPMAQATSQPPATGGVLPPAPQVPGVGASVSAYMPERLDLPHSACFAIAGSSPITWEQMLIRFSDMPDPATDLGELGWSEAFTRQFGCDSPPAAAAAWIDIAVHRFATPAFAQGAVPYYAVARRANTALQATTPPAFGEASAAVVGPAETGTELTYYVSRGTLLVRVTGVAAGPAPLADVAAVTRQVLIMVEAGEWGLNQDAATALQLLPDRPALPYSRCFREVARGVHTPAAVLPADVVEGCAGDLADGAYLDFRCDTPPPGGANYVGIVMHHFQTPALALQARAIWEGWPTDPAREARACGTSGTV
ncbi:MAG: neutral zinc metallopeptidase, partial [Chloroflexota bacterium]